MVAFPALCIPVRAAVHFIWSIRISCFCSLNLAYSTVYIGWLHRVEAQKTRLASNWVTLRWKTLCNVRICQVKPKVAVLESDRVDDSFLWVWTFRSSLVLRIMNFTETESIELKIQHQTFSSSCADVRCTFSHDRTKSFRRKQKHRNQLFVALLEGKWALKNIKYY